MRTVVTGMTTPTAITCSAHRWIQRGSLLGQTSNSVNTAVAARPRMMVRKNSADRDPIHPCIISRPTTSDIVNATAVRCRVLTTVHYHGTRGRGQSECVADWPRSVIAQVAAGNSGAQRVEHRGQVDHFLEDGTPDRWQPSAESHEHP